MPEFKQPPGRRRLSSSSEWKAQSFERKSCALIEKTEVQMRALIGPDVVDQHKDKKWIVVKPANKTIDATALAIRQGNYDLSVHPEMVMVSPRFKALLE